jgi:hypothetical protein
MSLESKLRLSSSRKREPMPTQEALAPETLGVDANFLIQHLIGGEMGPRFRGDDKIGLGAK